MDEKVLAGMAGVVTLFISGAVFDRLHGPGQTGPTAIGDRVMCGLIAIPLIAATAHYALPEVSLRWAVAAPIPLAIYVVLLAATDVNETKNRWRNAVKSNFVEWLLVPIGIYYVVVAMIVWGNA